MSKTLGQVAELIQRIYEGGDLSPTSKLDFRECIMHCEIALSDIIKTKAEIDFQKGSRDIDGQYVISYKNVSVVKDSDLNLYYSSIPESGISLPNLNSGIVSVSLMKSQNNSFIPLSNGIIGLLGAQDAWCLEGQVGFYVENGNIFFVNGSKLAGKSVLIKMASTGEDTMVSQGIEGQIIDIVLKRLGTQVPEDIINDNTNRKDL